VKIRTLIVDDEALARARLRKLLAGAEEIEIVGECSNGPDAIAFIRGRRPDLAFLDVQMPEVSGFDVLRALPAGLWPAVVFVTAHDQHAIEAFAVQALDYLLKPFTQARLLAAVERALRHLQLKDTADLNDQLAAWLKTSSAPAPAYLQRIAVKNGSQIVFIKIEDIDTIESAVNYAVIQTAKGNHILRETLTNLEGRLPPQLFLRISRSVIVNVERIQGIQSGARGESLIVLQGGRQLLMTRGLREIQEKLQYPVSRASEVRP
jgi:two-component system LytT family response regulator